MHIGFDVISDLYLTPDDNFNWEGKATSLYCIIAGNISNDLKIIRQTLTHLSRFYQGLFYCLGALEYEDINTIPGRTKEIIKICNTIRNVALLHHHVVIVDNVAILGSNGWYCNTKPEPLDTVSEIELEVNRQEDLIYLKNSVGKLQKHLDVKSIVLVSNSVPSPKLFFGQEPNYAKDQIPLDIILEHDTENKITHWIYGTYDKVVDTKIGHITYVNNSCYKKIPYWAKRIDV